MQLKKFAMIALTATVSASVSVVAANACPKHTSSTSTTTTTTMPAVIQPVAPSVITYPTITAPVVSPVTTDSVIRTTVVSSPAPGLSLGTYILGLNHMDRLTDMMDQVKLGSDRGWLTADELSSLNAERDRIASMINSYSSGGLTTPEVDEIEKSLTLFNQHIASEINDSEGSFAGSTIVPF